MLHHWNSGGRRVGMTRPVGLIAVLGALAAAPSLLAQQAPSRLTSPVPESPGSRAPVTARGAGTIMLPPDFAETEGFNNEGTALGLFSNTAQLVYGADLLAEAGLLIGDRITELAFRVDSGYVAPVWSVTDYQIRLATSLNPPGRLDPNFVNNRGADYTVVRAGPLAYDGSEYPSGGAPNDFGPPIAFQTAFVYTGGDLLIEYTHTTIATGGSAADAHEPDPRMQSQFAPGFDGTMEGFGGQGVGRGTVLQLTVDGCPADLDDSGAVDVGDLLTVLQAWGSSGPADLDGNGVVDTGDLLIVLAAWGSCA